MHPASPLSTVHCFCVHRGRSLLLPVPYLSTHVAELFAHAAALALNGFCIAAWFRSLSLPVPYSSTHDARIVSALSIQRLVHRSLRPVANDFHTLAVAGGSQTDCFRV